MKTTKPKCVIEPGNSQRRHNLRSVLNKVQPLATADLIFADPPFNIGRDYGEYSNDNKTPEEYQEFTRNWISACHSVLSPGGHFFIHVPDEVVPYVLKAMSSYAAFCPQTAWIIWHYRFGQYRADRLTQSHVHLLRFTNKNGDAINNIDELLEPSVRLLQGDKRTQDAPREGYRPMMDVGYGDNLGRVQGNNAERRPQHNNQLPEMYLARIIRWCSNPGSVVLDPFVGSGTTPTVAHALGRSFAGLDVSPKYVKSAKQRVAMGPVRDVGGRLFDRVLQEESISRPKIRKPRAK